MQLPSFDVTNPDNEVPESQTKKYIFRQCSINESSMDEKCGTIIALPDKEMY